MMMVMTLGGGTGNGDDDVGDKNKTVDEGCDDHGGDEGSGDDGDGGEGSVCGVVVAALPQHDELIYML